MCISTNIYISAYTDEMEIEMEVETDMIEIRMMEIKNIKKMV